MSVRKAAGRLVHPLPPRRVCEELQVLLQRVTVGATAVRDNSGKNGRSLSSLLILFS